MRKFWIIPRHAWKALPAKNRTTDRWSHGVTIVVHHTAGTAPTSRSREEAEMRAIQRLHFAQGWADIGYNYVIMPSGRVYEARGYNIRGAHTRMHNTQTIGVAFAGNYDVKQPSVRSLIAYRLLLRRLRQHGARIDRVKGHRQMPEQATACPGKYLMRALKL